jgi:EpsD family peptidyl-prolyl cis-trans isomerase
LTLLAAGCSQQAQTKGQVIATVNGKEITPQDLQSEARSNAALAQADSSVLLQRVIARELMAQAAHNQGLDRYPGYPSDIARLKEDFIAQRLARASIKPPAAPTAAELAKVMASNPYAFAQRETVTVDDITMTPPEGSVQSLESLKYPSDVIGRLARLNTPYSRHTLTLDTAKVPAALAARLATAPLGEQFFVRSEGQLAAMTVTARAPNAAPPEDATASATQLFQGAQVQQQLQALIGQLRAKAKIVYGNGFVPPNKPDALAAKNSLSISPAPASSTTASPTATSPNATN